MIVFLTSSPSGPLDVPNYDKLLDEKNGFVENLLKAANQYVDSQK